MTDLHHHGDIQSLCAPFAAVAFDAFGVLWDGKKAYDGAANNLAILRAQGKKIAIVTNTTQLAPQTEAEYAKRGFEKGVHYDLMLTAGDVARESLLSRAFRQIVLSKSAGGNYCSIGRPNPGLFENTGMTEVSDPRAADFVYIGAPEKDGIRQKNAEVFLPELKGFLDLGLPLFCANPDYYAPSGGTYNVCQGLIAKTYEDMGGKVEWGGGKPFPEIFDACAGRLGIADRSSICMVGDTLRTDIAGARAAGFKSALVIETGVTADAIKAGTTLAALCAGERTVPHFTLPRVGVF